MINRLSLLLVLLIGGVLSAQETDGSQTAGADQPRPITREVEETLDDDRETLVVKLCDSYWATTDKKENKRNAEPMLSTMHEKMTRQWVAKLKEEDFDILRGTELNDVQAKRKKELEKEFLKKSQEVIAQIAIARRVSNKVIKSHWDGMAQTGVSREAFPEYAREFEVTIQQWFFDRSVEDLKIFEKSRPNASERERGDKITAELVKKIVEVKQKYDGNMR
jgi:hypothetical protein